ncbi:MAG: LOG family protein [Desulfobacterales bacterium]|nr:LOG family protein [Desulfobacterales bacterium]
MAKKTWNNQTIRGVLQSDDGIIIDVLESDRNNIIFYASFKLSELLIEELKNKPEHLIFSERSRIARLGVQVVSEKPYIEALKNDTITLKLTASPVIPGYPGLDVLKEFFVDGLPIGRFVFCDPEALLTSDEVIEAIESSELKLPASTNISSDGSIFIASHKVVYELKKSIDSETLGKILLKEDGREILNRYQIRKKVKSVIIPPSEGVITTCSMYLNDHYVVLQSGNESSLGRHLPATILDPIKTRGIRIYLEIVNRSNYPIVNPLISAKIYRASKIKDSVTNKKTSHFSYSDMRIFEKKLKAVPPSTCYFLDKPGAMIQDGQDSSRGIDSAQIFMNGPEKECHVNKAKCAACREDFSRKSSCSHIYSTHKIKEQLENDKSSTLVLKYFPNSSEHHDIIDMACDGRIHSLYFFEPSWEYGPFLSQIDHTRLEDYHAFGLDVYWVSSLNKSLMVHTIRDRKGYFVIPDRLADFQKSMLFAFYGSNKELSKEGVIRLGKLMDALISFWGKNIGIVTGGGSGVMGHANILARERGILSGANFLDITDQTMTTDVDFCQVFQSSCRHSRQKWFEITSFPIFNVGGLGSLEEVGITVCNMKLSILEPVPIILFDTEGDGSFWSGMEKQIKDMVKQERAPAWIIDNLVITNNPQVVIDAYRERLHLF